MNPEEILNNKAFQGIEKERIDAVKNIIEEAKGKSQAEALMVIVKNRKALSTGGEISKAQQEEMLNALYDGLTDEGREQFKGILTVLEKYT